MHVTTPLARVRAYPRLFAAHNTHASLSRLVFAQTYARHRLLYRTQHKIGVTLGKQALTFCLGGTLARLPSH
jgi:hypothetical protein